MPVFVFFFSLSLALSKKRFSKQYSKEYKAKEVSEGEESKDFWNVLDGKANFLSLSGGLYCTILCILVILNIFYARYIQGSTGQETFKEENLQLRNLISSPIKVKSTISDSIWPGNYIFLSGKSQGIFKTDVCGNHVIAVLFVQ